MPWNVLALALAHICAVALHVLVEILFNIWNIKHVIFSYWNSEMFTFQNCFFALPSQPSECGWQRTLNILHGHTAARLQSNGNLAVWMSQISTEWRECSIMALSTINWVPVQDKGSKTLCGKLGAMEITPSDCKWQRAVPYRSAVKQRWSLTPHPGGDEGLVGYRTNKFNCCSVFLEIPLSWHIWSIFANMIDENSPFNTSPIKSQP